ncbi:Pentatricopeptide repeat-containing protein [Forsythia ovata]|uniref:Pentatricopeptide repeat-containing protein n=1 Tax=Forsythia ovata TaxID=205694 RepID=A0ABD1TMB8_9LAMI
MEFALEGGFRRRSCRTARSTTVIVEQLDNSLFPSFNCLKGKNAESRFSKCSLLHQQGLRSRPMPKPFKTEEKKLKGETETHLDSSKFNSGTCGQIEKLVLCKRYHEAFELFEILECEGGNDVKCSTYDALVSACIGLKSIRGVKRVFNYMLNSGFEMDLYTRNRVLLMHVKCGMMIDAHRLFDTMPEMNLVS